MSSSAASGPRSVSRSSQSSGSLEDMREVAEQVAAVVREVPGMEEVKVEQTTGLPTLTIDIDREAIARLGVNAQDVLAVIETIGGTQVGTVVEGQRRYSLQVRFDAAVRENLEALAAPAHRSTGDWRWHGTLGSPRAGRRNRHRDRTSPDQPREDPAEDHGRAQRPGTRPRFGRCRRHRSVWRRR